MARLDLSYVFATTAFYVKGPQLAGHAGASVSSAGDFNGDGFDDFIVGAPYVDAVVADGGQAYIIFGKAGQSIADINIATLAPTDGIIISGDALADEAGSQVSGAGDVNGDGFDDVILGVRNGDNGGNGAGEAYVIYGSAAPTNVSLTTLTTAQGFIIQGDLAGDAAGASVSGAGDINDDGFADVVVGAVATDFGGTNSGAAYVIYGKASRTTHVDLTGLATADGFKIIGDLAQDQLGTSVSGAGDVNGDGIDDLAVRSLQNVFVPAPGKVTVIFGAAGATRADIDLSTLAATDGFSITLGTDDLTGGVKVAALGDTNGDGLADLIMGRAGSDRATVIFGKAGATRANIDGNALASSDGFHLLVGDPNDAGAIGWSVATAGDINNDGFDDILIGAPYGTPAGAVGSQHGEVHVVFGKTGATRADVDLSSLSASDGFRIEGADGGAQAGISVSSAGDVNSDGFDDFVVGATGGGTGGAFVILGRATFSQPVLDNPVADQAGQEDTPVSFQVPANSFSDGGGPLDYHARRADGSPLPTWLAFNAGTRTFSGTPTANFNGTIAIEVVASNGAFVAVDTFNLTIAAVNDPPVAVDDAFTTVLETPINILKSTLLQNDVDVDFNVLTVPSISNATGGTVTVFTGSVTFTPTPGFVGIAGFDYTVSDGTLTDVGHVTISVTPPPVPPRNDFDADGDSDLLMQRTTDGLVQIHRGEGGVMIGYGTKPVGSIVALGDFDSDGAPDIVFQLATGSWRSYSGASGAALYTYGVLTNREVIAVADFDGDFIDDLLLRRTNDGLTQIYRGDGSGVMTGFGNKPAGSILAVGDFDENGLPDVVFRLSTGAVRSYTGLTGAQVGSYGVLTGHTLVAVADFDADGGDDLLFQRNSDGLTQIFNGEGGVQLSLGNLPVGGIEAVGDFNADMRPDLLVRDAVNILRAYSGSDGTVLTNFGDMTNKTVVALGHFNADFRIDILVQRSTDGLTQVYKGEGGLQVGFGNKPIGSIRAVGDFAGSDVDDIVFVAANGATRSHSGLDGSQVAYYGLLPDRVFIEGIAPLLDTGLA